MAVRRGLVTVLAICFVAVAGAPLYAFHDGGVGSCSGCHVMHFDPAGAAVVSVEGQLLLANSATDVCLSCHATGVGAVLGEDPLAPPPETGAGNFVFLLEDNLNDATDGRTQRIHGDAAGHNVVAPGYGLTADARWQFSPGGDFPAAQMECTSCHDPHGSTAFRFLHGSGPVNGGAYSFSAPAPQAEGIDVATSIEAEDNHTAYRSGMSNWCGNCHGLYHEEGLSEFEHPADQLLDPEVRLHYDEYLGDDLPDSGAHDTAYLADVPFEDPTAQTQSREGPRTSSRVTCLSCHRAHASSAPRAGRWDFNVELLQLDGFASGSWPIPDPYRSPNQGPLCSKCHLDPEGPEDPLDELPGMPVLRQTELDDSGSR